LFSKKETFKNNFVEKHLDNNDIFYNNVEELDMDFTIVDVKKAISSTRVVKVL
jgi:hypothetical protein